MSAPRCLVHEPTCRSGPSSRHLKKSSPLTPALRRAIYYPDFADQETEEVRSAVMAWGPTDYLRTGMNSLPLFIGSFHEPDTVFCMQYPFHTPHPPSHPAREVLQ